MHEHGNPAEYLITTRYIESLRDMTKGNNAKVIFMPVLKHTQIALSLNVLRTTSSLNHRGTIQFLRIMSTLL